MRRFSALIALFVLSLSRFGAVAMPSIAHARSIGRVEMHELAAPAVRVAAHALRAATPREQVSPLVPWLAPAVATIGVAELRCAHHDIREADLVALGEWRASTYDATAPPTLS